MTAPLDVDNLARLLEQRDHDATPPDGCTSWGIGKGVLTTDEVRRALLGDEIHGGNA